MHINCLRRVTSYDWEKSTQSVERIQKRRIVYTFKLCGLESKSFGIVAHNRFEEDEDARIYLRNTLKQGSMSFEEYNLFAQKKEKS